VANFVYPSNPQSVWIGEIIKQGETNYNTWLKINQSLAYYYKEDLEPMNELLEALQNPFEENIRYSHLAIPPKDEEKILQTFCGT
jgi:uncharacterized protein YdiU (UPF0061 family)